jgi:SNF2 family DNA or RNA helicase
VSEKFKIGDIVIDIFSQKRGPVVGSRDVGGRKEWLVFFSQNDKQYVNEDFLKIEKDCPVAELFKKGEFLGIDELKRILSFMKIKGDLTNIYYSMHNSAADFMAHQFKPVMKFIESTAGRLLIADEVGLGKTIEAMYIWEELIARENSQRLLIVCPAVLCEKWKADMSRYFSIDAQIAKCEDLLESL